jgi:hypothetical protein
MVKERIESVQRAPYIPLKEPSLLEELRFLF